MSEGRLSTGLRGLDDVLDGLRIGDNVVWRVSELDDYRRFAERFIESVAACDREIIYLRFGDHPAVTAKREGVRVIELDAVKGFENFTSQVWRLIELHGRGAFYIFDCLSDLLNAWATDVMVGNFFRVICPFLYELDTVAWFVLQTGRHSNMTLDRIRETTQVLIDVNRYQQEIQIHPIKASGRKSATMFLPHRESRGQFRPVTDSIEATYLQHSMERENLTSKPLLDNWDKLFEDARRALENQDEHLVEAFCEEILQVLISRDPRILQLARQFLALRDLLHIRSRLIGSGYIGGKASGMLIGRAILLKQAPEIWERYLEPHDSFFLGSDVYYAFLVHNGLWSSLMRQRTESGYLSEAKALGEKILAGLFPPEIKSELKRLLDHYGQYPILVRSSSLLEDGFGNAFAGKYESVFLINQGSPEQRLERLETAIRLVYASSMSQDALTYRKQRQLDKQEEPMALLIQRVNGRFHDEYYLPDAAGVGVSKNTFAWDSRMDPDAGMVRLVMGLGTRAVDRIEGDHACVMALDHPTRQPFRNEDESFRYSQHVVDLLDISDGRLASKSLSELLAAVKDLPLAELGEIDRTATMRARELGINEEIWRLTFAPLVHKGLFIQRLSTLLTTLEDAYDHAVDIEFTLHFASDGDPSFNLVQCRPLATIGKTGPISMPQELDMSRVLFRSKGHFMGGNMNLAIERVIRVDASAYARLESHQRYDLGRQIGHILRSSKCPTMLIGPGRWGTSSPQLGVPVKFADISEVDVLVEVAENAGELVPDLSYGSHFFQDLVETGIAYVALFPDSDICQYLPETLRSMAQIKQLEGIHPSIHIYDLSEQAFRVLADVKQQEIVCFKPDHSDTDGSDMQRVEKPK